MSVGTIVLPETELERAGTGRDGNWVVIVFDNDHNTWEQVISILMLATECTLEEAEMETWEVHHLGKSLVHHGSEAECEKVAEIIRTIGIRVETAQV
jgi:ATP-dependent Clp protease adapter protein ClpS